MNYPGIGENEAVYAVGDIHGRADLLDRLFRRIDADKMAQPKKRAIEIYLGDYIDRGPDSADVIARLRSRTAAHEAICLLGNHEAMLLDAIDGRLPIGHWLDNGGGETLVSYGIEMPFVGAPRRSCLDRLPIEDVAFLRSLRLHHRHGPYLFVHAGIRPGIPLDEQTPEDLVWIRDEFLTHDGPLGAIVVHGHTPVDAPEFRRNRIGIDTGAVFSGRLTCLRIDGRGVATL